MCLALDYRGFRLIAEARLPITKATIVYGSADGGVTIHDKDPIVNAIMERAAKVLNLKSHYVTSSGSHKRTRICGPFDIEVHSGTDGRYYIIDFARTFPAEPPSRAHKTGHLYRMLRPELVRTHPRPLSSDAFCSIENDSASDAEVIKARNRLFHTVIPMVAKRLDTEQVYGKVREVLSAYVHQSGINIRYLGKLRAKLTSLPWKDILLQEMVARTLKNELRARFRATMKKMRYISSQPYRKVALDFVNLVFGNNEESKVFWNFTLKILVHKKFGLPAEELDEKYNLKRVFFSRKKTTTTPQASRSYSSMAGKQSSFKGRGGKRSSKSRTSSKSSPSATPDMSRVVNMCSLFLRFISLVGIVLEPSFRLQLHDAVFFQPCAMLDSNLQVLVETVKHMNIIPYAQGTALFIQSRKMMQIAAKRGPNFLLLRKEADRMAALAKMKFDEALSRSFDDYQTLCNYSFLVCIELKTHAHNHMLYLLLLCLCLFVR